MNKINGILAAMATPMLEDESINREEIKNQVNRFIEAGIHGLFCLGTNGEFYALSKEEKIEVMKTVIEEAKGRIKIYAGTGCVTTKETIELTKIAKDLGVDAVSLISPYFAENSQESLYYHFKKVAEAVDIPIILYNIPARTGVHMDYRTVKKLSEIPNIVGVKDSSGNFDNILRYIEETDSDFSVLSGNDSLILWTLMAGGSGGISGISNILPETMVNIYECWKAGNIEEAKKYQDSIRPIRDCLKFGNPNTIVKYAASYRGNNIGSCRAPFSVLSENAKKQVEEVLQKYYSEAR